VSSCRLLPKQRVTRRRRSCRRGRSLKSTWLRSPGGALPRDPVVQALSPARRHGRRRHAHLGEQRVFSRRFSSGSRCSAPCAWLLSAARASSPILCPATLRARATLRDPPDGRATRVRYVLPRHKAANWVGPGRSRKSTRPVANGVVDLLPFEFLDRLDGLVPPPRKHRHR